MPATARKPVSLKDIAAAVGVSVATTSMALADHPHVSETTKERVRAVAKERGYIRRTRKPRRNGSAVTRSNRIGFLLIGSPVNEDLHLGVLHTLCLRASDVGSRVDLQALEDLSDPGRTVRTVQEFCRGLSGVLLTGLIDRQILSAMNGAGVPYVTLGSCMDSFQTFGSGTGQMVTSNIEGMAELAVERLINLGHKRIGFIVERVPAGLWNARWLRGYQLGHLEHGLPLTQELIHISGVAHSGAMPAVQHFMSLKKRPTAYIVPDARLAASFLDSMKSLDQPVDPRSLVISGYLPLITRYGVEAYPWIGHDLDHLAGVAVRQLRALAEGPMPCPTEIMLPFSVRNFD